MMYLLARQTLHLIACTCSYFCSTAMGGAPRKSFWASLVRAECFNCITANRTFLIWSGPADTMYKKRVLTSGTLDTMPKVGAVHLC